MFTNLSIFLKSIPLLLPFVKEILLGRRKNVGGRPPNVLRPWLVLTVVGLLVVAAVAANTFFTGYKTESGLHLRVHRLEYEKSTALERNLELAVKNETLNKQNLEYSETISKLSRDNRDLNDDYTELESQLKVLRFEYQVLENKLKTLEETKAVPPTVNKAKVNSKTHNLLREVLE